VPDGTDITALALNIDHTGKSINPVSGSVQNFTTPVTYTVTAEDDSQKPFNVSATVDATPQSYTSPYLGVFKPVIGGTFQRDDDSGNITEVSTFRMAQYEVTQAQYMAVTGAPNPSWCVTPNVFQNDLNRPVEKVTWFDAVEFCNKLSELEGIPLAYNITGRTPASGHPITDAVVTLTGENGYRLPTGAEWQWASMGASDNRNKAFSGSNGSNNIEDYAWLFDNSMDGLLPADSDYGTHAVGTKLPNELGLYDMNGNVEEWCWDLYDSYPSGTLENPKGAVSSTFRLVRGGSWISKISRTNLSFRRYFYPGLQFDFYGIRVIRQ
jgi:formylglycine-generating enzyme required for sulfatase activity